MDKLQVLRTFLFRKDRPRYDAKQHIHDDSVAIDAVMMRIKFEAMSFFEDTGLDEAVIEEKIQVVLQKFTSLPIEKVIHIAELDDETGSLQDPEEKLLQYVFSKLANVEQSNLPRLLQHKKVSSSRELVEYIRPFLRDYIQGKKRFLPAEYATPRVD